MLMALDDADVEADGNVNYDDGCYYVEDADDNECFHRDGEMTIMMSGGDYHLLIIFRITKFQFV